MNETIKTESIVCTIKNSTLADNVTSETIEAIAGKSSVKAFPGKQIIYYQDEPNDKFYVIKKGKVKISKFTPEGKEITIEILGDGEAFGYISLLGNEISESTITTLSKSHLIVLRKYEFAQIIKHHPEIFKCLLLNACQRIRNAYQHIETISSSNAKQRVARILLELARQEGEYQGEYLIFKSRLTHQELANLAGTSRETVTRVLTFLKKTGYIKVNRSIVTILKEDEMEESF